MCSEQNAVAAYNKIRKLVQTFWRCVLLNLVVTLFRPTVYNSYERKKESLTVYKTATSTIVGRFGALLLVFTTWHTKYFSPRLLRALAVGRCGLLPEMSHVAWSICVCMSMCLCVCHCLFLCWQRGKLCKNVWIVCDAVWDADGRGPKELCIRWGVQTPH